MTPTVVLTVKELHLERTTNKGQKKHTLTQGQAEEVNSRSVLNEEPSKLWVNDCRMTAFFGDAGLSPSARHKHFR